MPPRMKRQELLFQDHIIDSYNAQGGYAKKWSTDLTVGNPDLICAFPGFGHHLIETKHRPQFSLMREEAWDNQLDARQMVECRRHIDGGGVALAGLIIGSSQALGSILLLFDPRDKTWDRTKALPLRYVAGKKYDILTLLTNARRRKIGGFK